VMFARSRISRMASSLISPGTRQRSRAGHATAGSGQLPTIG